jgi:2-C-methyl-D-erythritol 4-phosphate cytidylyltransferase / 2-C-methyl-D-erythritol 2,4-cyclodiphosphate synthase
MRIAALIMAAGQGERAGGERPKQYCLLGGKSLVARCVEAFRAHPSIDQVHIVIGVGQENWLEQALDGFHPDSVTIGGATRQESVFSGLKALGAVDAVLIHDAARPLIPAAVLDRLVDGLREADGVVPVLPVVDTLAQNGEKLGVMVDRDQLVRVQTPQAFRLSAIMTSHQNWQGGPATDDAQMLRHAGFSVAMVEGDAMLDKITHPADFALAEARLGSGLRVRTGMGYDVHRFASDRELWLCGLLIPHDLGLAGHSDADVALHALTDALLGAAGQGDIGDHFPPSDPQWSGAPSSRFLQHAADKIRDMGGEISNVDVTIICEAPKIAPYRPAMRARIAELLRVKLEAVSVKATTTEGLGFTGRGEGIAAQAVATIRMKD